MQNHYFNEDGVYTGSAPALDGTEPPDNALRLKPPVKKGFWPVLDRQRTGWDMLEDHRGRRGWLHGYPTVIDRLGALPDGWEKAPTIDGNDHIQPSDKRIVAYRVEADPIRDEALSYQMESEALRLLGRNAPARTAMKKAEKRLARYLEIKESIRNRHPNPQSHPAPEESTGDDGPLYFLTRSGTYHRKGCAYTTAVGKWLSGSEISKRKSAAHPCRRCEPAILE